MKCNICGKPYKKDGWLWKHKRKLGHLTDKEKLAEEWYRYYGRRLVRYALACIRDEIPKKKIKPGTVIKFYRYGQCPPK